MVLATFIGKISTKSISCQIVGELSATFWTASPTSLDLSRVRESAAAAVGVFARPFSDRASLQDLVGHTESRPIAERPAGPHAAVGRKRDHYRHRVKKGLRYRGGRRC